MHYTIFRGRNFETDDLLFRNTKEKFKGDCAEMDGVDTDRGGRGTFSMSGNADTDNPCHVIQSCLLTSTSGLVRNNHVSYMGSGHLIM